MSLVVLSNPDLDGARGVVHVDAVHEYEARGWVVVGPAISPLDPRTVEEIADAESTADAEIAAAVAERDAAALAASVTPDDTPVVEDPVEVLDATENAVEDHTLAV